MKNLYSNWKSLNIKIKLVVLLPSIILFILGIYLIYNFMTEVPAPVNPVPQGIVLDTIIKPNKKDLIIYRNKDYSLCYASIEEIKKTGVATVNQLYDKNRKPIEGITAAHFIKNTDDNIYYVTKNESNLYLNKYDKKLTFTFSSQLIDLFNYFSDFKIYTNHNIDDYIISFGENKMIVSGAVSSEKLIYICDLGKKQCSELAKSSIKDPTFIDWKDNTVFIKNNITSPSYKLTNSFFKDIYTLDTKNGTINNIYKHSDGFSDLTDGDSAICNYTKKGNKIDDFWQILNPPDNNFYIPRLNFRYDRSIKKNLQPSNIMDLKFNIEKHSFNESGDKIEDSYDLTKFAAYQTIDLSDSEIDNEFYRNFYCMQPYAAISGMYLYNNNLYFQSIKTLPEDKYFDENTKEGYYEYNLSGKKLYEISAENFAENRYRSFSKIADVDESNYIIYDNGNYLIYNHDTNETKYLFSANDYTIIGAY